MVVAEYASRLAARGHQVCVISSAGEASPLIALLLSEVEIRKTEISLERVLKNRWGQLRFCWQLAQKVPSSDWVIATHTPTTIPTLLATSWFWRKGSPSWLYADFREMFDTRTMERWLVTVAPRFFKRLLVFSRDSQEEIWKNCKKKSMVVGLGLSNLADFNQVIPRAVNQTPFKVMTITDKRPRKGLTDFLSAMDRVGRKISGLQLIIVSKEPLEVDSSLPYRLFINPPRSRLIKLLHEASLFVSASWKEGFGLPPLEAMASGTPVVLTDSGGVRDYAQNEVNCLLVPPKSPVKLAEAIIQLLNDNRLAEKFSRAGLETVKTFSWEKATDRFEQALSGPIPRGILPSTWRVFWPPRRH